MPSTLLIRRTDRSPALGGPCAFPAKQNADPGRFPESALGASASPRRTYRLGGAYLAANLDAICAV